MDIQENTSEEMALNIGAHTLDDIPQQELLLAPDDRPIAYIANNSEECETWNMSVAF